MSRTRKIAIGVLIVLLAAAPFVPRGSDEDGSVTPIGKAEKGALATSATAGLGRVTPQMQAEIDRVVGASRSLGRMSTKVDPSTLADRLVRCADFDGQRYCLGTGWTDRTEADVQARIATAAHPIAARTARPAETTGDLDALAGLQRLAALDPAARAEAERRELTQAAQSVAKVWLLRHEVEGVALPDGFLAEHPEATASANAGTDADADAEKGKPKTIADYPQRDTVMRRKNVAEQVRTYWCGPTTMQMIAWGWQHEKRKPKLWARRLHTTSEGTAISDMVRVINHRTGWDRKHRAGPYIVLDISNWSFEKWLLLQMRHITDYRAPVVLHPVLLKKYYPYLDDDASGHFQAGRGYDKNGDQPPLIGYFEPWNQQRFDPSEPYINRVQWQAAYKSFRANKAHFQQNIGV
jgi:hypothetical protein